MDIIKNLEEAGDRVDRVDGDEVDPTPPLFTHQHLIVKQILEKLPVQDLLSASQTCSTWADIGRSVRMQRKNRSWVMLYHPYGNHTLEAFEFFNETGYAGHRRNIQISDAAREFMKNAYLQGFPSPQHLIRGGWNKGGWPYLIPQIRATSHKGLLESYFEPQMLVVFATSAVNLYVWNGSHSILDYKNMHSLEILFGKIPENIPRLATSCHRIVAPLPNEHKSLKMDNFEFPLVSTLAIPKIPGLRVKMFHHAEQAVPYSRTLYSTHSENCKRILNISPEDNVKGIIIFHTDFQNPAYLEDAIFYYLRENPHVAFGGGAHYKNLTSDFYSESPIAAGMIICGDENVIVASVPLLDSEIRLRDDKLIEMKSCEMSGGDSFAFLFEMYGTGDMESKLFRKHFPKTNLIGSSTKRVYCHEVIPTRNQQVPPPQQSSNLEFYDATVLVLVSYKYPVSPLTS